MQLSGSKKMSVDARLRTIGPNISFGRQFHSFWADTDNASVNSSCTHPPPPRATGGICAHFQFWGSSISLPLCYPQAFDAHTWFLTRNPTWRILLEKTGTLTPIGLFFKYWRTLLSFLKVCSLDFMYFLIAYQATT